jgi:hypothetical protein
MAEGDTVNSGGVGVPTPVVGDPIAVLEPVVEGLVVDSAAGSPDALRWTTAAMTTTAKARSAIAIGARRRTPAVGESAAVTT